ncbi:MAG: hypothetical protein HOC20_08125 [Chloroflexi bacterium]|jgi:hypothetical protein|nr:hypothetical protein [Chloroflexota bacterium]
MRTHVYSEICKHIETLSTDTRNQNILFLIFSELLQGNELGLDYLVKRYGTFTRQSVGRSTVQRMLRLLRDEGLVRVDIWGNRYEHRANHYTLTLKGHDLFRTSSMAYWTYNDYLRKRNTVRIGDSILQTNKWESEHRSIEDWFHSMPNNSETIGFVEGLMGLEARDAIFKRLEATRDQIVVVKRFFQLRNIPNEVFNIRYRPLSSGRMQSVPHTYIGKELVPYIRPADDPNLDHGILFSLDYSKQELRILASILDEASLIRQWANNSESGFEELLDLYDISIPRQLWKGFMYSFLYGSEGYALADQLSYSEAREMGYYNCHHAGRKIVSQFKGRVPEVNELREHFAEVFTLNQSITAPGGFTRHVDPEEDLTKKGSLKKNRARQIPLSHIIQGTGAYIARTIVAESVNLRYCQLHMPIHDGFVFYCRNGLYPKAVQEAGELMSTVAQAIVPNVPMPHKTEWVAGKEGQA